MYVCIYIYGSAPVVIGLKKTNKWFIKSHNVRLFVCRLQANTWHTFCETTNKHLEQYRWKIRKHVNKREVPRKGGWRASAAAPFLS